MNVLRALALILAFATTAAARELTVIGYNVESGGAEATVVGGVLESYDAELWGLSEVRNATDASTFESAAEVGGNAGYGQVLGTTGGGDRLLILYDEEVLELLSHEELHTANSWGSVRSPLVGRFQVRSTGETFLFMVNHLYRSRAERRAEQAGILNRWGRAQVEPVIAVGDYNFDWSVTDGDSDHDAAYDVFVADNVFTWARPSELVRTQDSSYNSVLDFVFVSGTLTASGAESDIIRRAGDFPDDNTTSDHRPVRGRIPLDLDAGGGGGEVDVQLRRNILARIDAIEAELAALRALLSETDPPPTPTARSLKSTGASPPISSGIRALLEFSSTPDSLDALRTEGEESEAKVDDLLDLSSIGTEGAGLAILATSEQAARDLLERVRSVGGEARLTGSRQILCARLPPEKLQEVLQSEQVALVTEAQSIDPPDIIRPRNLDARDTHQVDELVEKHDVRGDQLSVGVWDEGKVRTTHREFGGRAAQVDGATQLSRHATHVAGTIAANGTRAQARGMAPQVQVRAFDWKDDVLELASEAGTLVSTNHSYGLRRGWDYDSDNGIWLWWGLPQVDPSEDYLFGKYVQDSASFDEVVHDNPALCVVVAAGNDRNDNGPLDSTRHAVRTYRDGRLQWVWSNAPRNADGFDNGGYDTIDGIALAKNVITVGAINDITVDEPRPEHVRVTAFSNWGPADDGRVKPDVVGNGAQLFSPSSGADDAYERLSGTSMATPAVTGIVALLGEVYRKHFERDARSDELKAALIHTAMSPHPGPDYRIGWGSVRADWAGDLIAGETGSLLAGSANSEVVYSAKAKTGDAIRVTLVWIDPPAPVNFAGLDDRTLTLVHDLDLEVHSPEGKIFFPWSLDPSVPSRSASQDSKNTVDNVERVDVDAQEVGDCSSGSWTIRIRSASAGSQPFALAVSGLSLRQDAQAPDTPSSPKEGR